MKTYQVINSASGHNFGLYRGETPEQAIQAMLDDANHDGPADDDIEAIEVKAEPCIIIQKREFYAGTLGADGRARPVVDDYQKAIVFDSHAAAREWIDEKDEKEYFLSNGEVGRPEYWVVPADLDDWIGAVFQDGSLIEWQGCECEDSDGHPCGECDVCGEWVEGQIEKELRAAAIE